MARYKTTTCDCCEKVLVNSGYIIAKKRWMRDWKDTGNVKKFFVCDDCLLEIGRRVRENRKMEFDVEVRNGR